MRYTSLFIGKTWVHALARRAVILALWVGWPGLGLAQSGIAGDALVTVQEGPPDCLDSCVTVEVYADLVGLAGVGGPAGLNAFVLGFDLDRTGVFASARAGSSPIGDWSFMTTGRDQVDLTNRLIVAGAVANPAAPNANYHLATITLCGTQGDVTLTFAPTVSSLGSRVLAGDGPGPIGITAPAPITVTIPYDFPLVWEDALVRWLKAGAPYDLAPPHGVVDILDLVKAVNCGLP